VTAPPPPPSGDQPPPSPAAAPPSAAVTAPSGRPGPFPPAPATQQFRTVPPPPVPPPPPPPAPFSGPPVPAPLPRTGGSKAPVVLSVAALVLALVAVVLSGLALAGSRKASTASGSTHTGTGAGGAPVTKSTTQAPVPQPGAVTPAPSATPGQINPKADFGTPVYQDKLLTLHPTDCATTYIDLDEPRVGSAQQYSDLTFTGGCSSTGPVFNFGSRVGVAVATDPNEQPGECADMIQTGPLSSQYAIPLRQGVLLCLATSGEDAITQGIPQKIAVIEVRAVGADSTVSVYVTAWNVPR